MAGKLCLKSARTTYSSFLKFTGIVYNPTHPKKIQHHTMMVNKLSSNFYLIFIKYLGFLQFLTQIRKDFEVNLYNIAMDYFATDLYICVSAQQMGLKILSDVFKCCEHFVINRILNSLRNVEGILL